MKIINLGDRVQDVITGFQGVVTGRCQYISGCDQALVSPACKEDGSLCESAWFDVDRLDVTETKAISLTVTSPGADRPAPIK